MSLDRPTFPEYGGGGDVPGAMRARRAFQFCVAAAVLFTAALYLAEQYYRFDHAETLYRNGLTKHPESGRVELRSAVRTVEQRGELPPSKYLQALAEREESDRVLPTYRRAFEVDAANPDLAMRYGARLFLERQYIAARERFHDAVLAAPENVLPQYLESAAMVWSAEGTEDFDQAMAFLVRANGSALEASLPRVLWFPTLPRDSRAYADLVRKTADECAAPLYRLAERVIDMAPVVAETAGQERADTYLLAVQQMGERLAQSPDRVGPMALAGLTIQLRAAEERQRLEEMEGLPPNEALIRGRVKLQSAIDRIQQFESTREDRLEQHQAWVAFPLWRAIQGLSLAFMVYFAATILSHSMAASAGSGILRFVGYSAAAFFSGFTAMLVLAVTTGPARYYWPTPLRREAVAIISGTCGLLLLVLFGLTMGVAIEGVGADRMGGIRLLWLLILIAIGLFAVLNPAFTLPSAREAAARGEDGSDSRERLMAARSQRRRAWIVLSRRYSGLLAGILLTVVCVWFIGFRILTSSFPLQFVLVTPGLGSEEASVVTEALAQLE